MADLDRALDRLLEALAGGELIGVFGDYDVDGVTSAAVLTLALRGLGGRVVARVANRGSGYGLSPAEAERFIGEGCRVLVTGDCGTSDHEALELCRGRGVDAIVIDHHQVPAGATAAYALINPHRMDDRFPFKGLASCGVAFYLAAALRTRLRATGDDKIGSFDPRELLDLVALGTVADVVPLTDENRILVSAGLRELAARRRPGLRVLAELVELAPGAVSAIDISFRLTPRLNAAGRMGEAQRALDLLLAGEDAEARERALEIDDANRDRQRVQAGVWAEAAVSAEEQLAQGMAAIVVGAEGWHQGVVGIVAAKLVEKFARPAVVVGFQEGRGRGSARTLGGFNLYEALSACRAHLSVWGGHAAAAGMSVTADAFSHFREAFASEAGRYFANRPLAAGIEVDALAELADLTLAQADEIERLAPFGAANPEPLFALAGVTANATRVVGQGHLQLTLSQRGGIADAIAFGMADRDPGEGARIDLVGSVDVDTFRGNRRMRLRVKHMQRAET
jgi:single-stranded-DNA-specific exonuclease